MKYFIIIGLFLNHISLHCEQKSTDTIKIDPIKKLMQLDEQIKNLKADYIQEVYFKVANIKQNVEGKILYLKPDNMKIIHTKPSSQIIIINSKNDITIIKPKDRQIIKSRWEKWKMSLEPQLKGLFEFGNYSKIIEDSEIMTTVIKDGYIIEIKPKEKKFTLKLKLGLDFFPQEGELDLGDTSVKTIIKNIEINKEISKDEFEYKNKEKYEVLKL